jgi:hypothetical protein
MNYALELLLKLCLTNKSFHCKVLLFHVYCNKKDVKFIIPYGVMNFLVCINILYYYFIWTKNYDASRF